MFSKFCLLNSSVPSAIQGSKGGLYHGAYTKWMSEEVWFTLSASGNQSDVTPLGASHLKAGKGSQVLLITQKKAMQKTPSLSVQSGGEDR